MKAKRTTMKATHISHLLTLAVTATLALTSGLVLTTRAANITAEEARAIAKEAYIYGFPLVYRYRIQYAYFVENKNPEYKLPWTQIKNTPPVYPPEDKAVQTPN